MLLGLLKMNGMTDAKINEMSMLQTIKDNLAIIVIALCLATMVSQCSTCTRVAAVGAKVEEQQDRTDSLMIVWSNQQTAQVAAAERIEKKIDSAMYGGANKKPQANYIVIKK